MDPFRCSAHMLHVNCQHKKLQETCHGKLGDKLTRLGQGRGMDPFVTRHNLVFKM